MKNIKEKKNTIDTASQIIGGFQKLIDGQNIVAELGFVPDKGSPESQAALPYLQKMAKNVKSSHDAVDIVRGSLHSGNLEFINNFRDNDGRDYQNTIRNTVVEQMYYLAYQGVVSPNKIKEIYPWLELNTEETQIHMHAVAYAAAHMGFPDVSTKLMSIYSTDDIKRMGVCEVSHIVISKLVEQNKIDEAEKFISLYGDKYFGEGGSRFLQPDLAKGYAKNGDKDKSIALFTELFNKSKNVSDWEVRRIIQEMGEAGLYDAAIELLILHKAERNQKSSKFRYETPQIHNQKQENFLARYLAYELANKSETTNIEDIDKVCMMGMFDIAINMLGKCEITDYFHGITAIFGRLVQYEHYQEAMDLINQATKSLPKAQVEKIFSNIEYELAIAEIHLNPDTHEQLDKLSSEKKYALSNYAKKYGARVTELRPASGEFNKEEFKEIISGLTQHFRKDN